MIFLTHNWIITEAKKILKTIHFYSKPFIISIVMVYINSNNQFSYLPSRLRYLLVQFFWDRWIFFYSLSRFSLIWFTASSRVLHQGPKHWSLTENPEGPSVTKATQWYFKGIRSATRFLLSSGLFCEVQLYVAYRRSWGYQLQWHHRLVLSNCLV